MGPVGSLHFSQKPITGTYPDSVESRPNLRFICFTLVPEIFLKHVNVS
jgi:hypothetical protein